MNMYVGLNTINKSAKITDCRDALPCEITHFRVYEIDEHQEAVESWQALKNAGFDTCLDGFDIFIDYDEVH